MDLIKAGVFLCFGLVTGFFIPAAAQKLIRYKCRKRNTEAPEFYFPAFYKCLFLILNAGLFAAAGLLMPLESACVVCIFVFIALVSVIVDMHLRIICNEVVLLIFVLGIIYRVIIAGFQGLLGSLAALGIVIAVFGIAVLVTKLLAKQTGVGAGDVKLAMAIAVTVGFTGVFYFLGGLAIAIVGYCVLGLIHRYLTTKSTFPMCGHIMAGFIIALFFPYIHQIPNILF
jgi:leader peptidase (prepilin peptidase)/N-methyltransferase